MQGTAPGVIERTLTDLGLGVGKPLEGVPTAFVVNVTPAAVENPIKLANRLMHISLVLAAEPNVVVETEALYRPRDDLYPPPVAPGSPGRYNAGGRIPH